ncbi:methylglyoxal synthase [Alteribacter lacisalsi]|uniref:Methylglyoxal synthase n=1 Tax=Alteribacter lacisalsi TaxID=2045244 RepID=A0A2W0HNE3_9BACI|nr:methylglyoxal synthase [Alteribacter lacisalsi]PYZ98399.1 methylglyoxal synthase [Alteribacter lacisalsi]
MNIALIAHDQKKDEMVQFAVAFEPILKDHRLFSTGTTGKRVMNETNLQVHRYQSGPMGGDQQIGAMIAVNEMDLVLFFKDPLTAQPHEPDISALIRLCDVYKVPLATNIATGEILLKGLERGDLSWRNVIEKKDGTKDD